MLATGISRHFTSCIAQTGGISLQREDRQHPRGRGVVPAHCSQRTGAHARLHMHRSRQTVWPAQVFLSSSATAEDHGGRSFTGASSPTASATSRRGQEYRLTFFSMDGY
ncbi:uncharacterized protein LOC119353254 isoform X2 [Triticum dicoccoides]|uniref:uncharacterized protein LOC119353254 isoform X2 n=1 Tax=Triticum dicoccoides TaxID=85692 RepID=UPI0018905AD5|nr:uncharacterized protein LOC119353254 isoform X2 [Triticum dicoccoides]